MYIRTISSNRLCVQVASYMVTIIASYTIGLYAMTNLLLCVFVGEKSNR